MKRLLLATLLTAAVGTGYYFRDYFFRTAFFGTATETRSSRPAPAQPVVADVAAEMSAPIEVTAIGNIQSMATVMVKSRIDGEIAQVHFEEGQDVKAGDLLFSLDDRVARAQLQQSEANLERDRAQLRRFQLEVARQTGLANRGIAPAQKLEDVMTSEAVFEATVRASEAAVETARINLNFTAIRAPITGRTGSVALKRGNVVKAVDTVPTVMPMVTVAQLRPIYVTFTVPERHLGDLRAAVVSGRLPVVVTIPSSPLNPTAGQLTFIDNQVDAATGTISLKATFANDDGRLWPGQFVDVTVTLGVQTNALAVPSTAIQVGQNGPYVFVIKPDSTVELRLVRIDRSVNDKTVIAEGLTAGEHVVVDGQLRLTNGTRIAVQRSEEPAPPKAQPIPVAEQAP